MKVNAERCGKKEGARKVRVRGALEVGKNKKEGDCRGEQGSKYKDSGGKEG